MIKKLTEKDKKDWSKFLNKKEKLFDKEINEKQVFNNLEKTIDLHGYNLKSANEIIESFINKSYEEKISKIIVITGKGNRSNSSINPYKSDKFSILKHSVPEFIKTNSNLMKIIKKINYSGIDNNFSGSFEIYLKKIKE